MAYELGYGEVKDFVNALRRKYKTPENLVRHIAMDAQFNTYYRDKEFPVSQKADKTMDRRNSRRRAFDKEGNELSLEDLMDMIEEARGDRHSRYGSVDATRYQRDSRY